MAAANTGEQAYAARQKLTAATTASKGNSNDTNKGNGGGGVGKGKGKEKEGSLIAPIGGHSPTIITAHKEQGTYKEWKEQVEAIGRDAGCLSGILYEELSPAYWVLNGTTLRRVEGLVKELLRVQEKNKALEAELKAVRQEKVALTACPTGPKGYAAAAAMGLPRQAPPTPPPSPPPAVERTMEVNRQEQRRVTLRVRKPDEWQEISRQTARETISAFTAPEMNEATKKIVAVYKKEDAREVVLVTSSPEARMALEKRREWATAKYSSVEVRAQTYLVRAHGVSVGLMEDNKVEHTRARLNEENKEVHNGLCVLSVKKPKTATKPRLDGRMKVRSSMELEVSTPEEVNSLVELGLVVEGDLCPCELWQRNLEIKQCFRCGGYGHIARNCRNPESCGVCAGGHSTRLHVDQVHGAKPKCNTCGGDHVAWSKACLIRQKEVARINQKRANKPVKFAVERAVRAAPVVDEEGFTVVASRQMRKKRRAEEDTQERAKKPLGRPRKVVRKEGGQQALQLVRGESSMNQTKGSMNQAKSSMNLANDSSQPGGTNEPDSPMEEAPQPN